MSRYYQAKLNSVYFTSDGTSAGTPCKLKVSGLSIIKLNYHGRTEIAVSGMPAIWNFQAGNKGYEISIEVEFITQTVLNQLIAQISNAIQNSLSMTLELTNGDLGNFTLSVLAKMPEAIEGGEEFSNGIIKNIKFNFITRG